MDRLYLTVYCLVHIDCMTLSSAVIVKKCFIWLERVIVVYIFKGKMVKYQ